MEYIGNIQKMRSELMNPVVYYLKLGENEIRMNDLIGSDIQMEFLHEINCIKCGRATKKSFAQGFCYPCFISSPETEECVLRPEMCRAHEGIARDMEFAKSHCLIDHVVYLSVTSNLKVGVTRSTQVPFRWIDQGAVQAIEVCRTPNRYLAGRIEVFLKNHYKDKTNWMAMLKNESEYSGGLKEAKVHTASLLPQEFLVYLSKNSEVTNVNYPVVSYPTKVKSANFDKVPILKGRLTGIRGQYLLFEDNTTINMRKFGGYKIRLTV